MTVHTLAKSYKPCPEAFRAVNTLYRTKLDESLPPDTFSLIDLDDESDSHDSFEVNVNLLIGQIEELLIEFVKLVRDSSEDVRVTIFRTSNFDGSYMSKWCIAAAACAFACWEDQGEENLHVSFDSERYANQILTAVIRFVYDFWRKERIEREPKARSEFPCSIWRELNMLATYTRLMKVESASI